MCVCVFELVIQLRMVWSRTGKTWITSGITHSLRSSISHQPTTRFCLPSHHSTHTRTEFWWCRQCLRNMGSRMLSVRFKPSLCCTPRLNLFIYILYPHLFCHHLFIFSCIHFPRALVIKKKKKGIANGCCCGFWWWREPRCTRLRRNVSPKSHSPFRCCW